MAASVLSAERLPYVREIREVEVEGRTYLVHAFSILTTDDVVFDAYEPYSWDRETSRSSHSTSRSFTPDDFHARPGDPVGNFGAVRTRELPPEIRSLPFGPERSRRCIEFNTDLDDLCERVVQAAFPEIVLSTKDGHGWTTLPIWHAEIRKGF